MLTIDGSRGEGGGQILRTSLALSLITGTPFRMEKVRLGRKKPGLMRQHLTAVTAAAEVGNARVEGAALGSTELSFTPGPVAARPYRFAIGTAGSTMLVLQTVLPPLLTADGPSTVVLEGGTHNTHAPPFEFIERAFLPLVNKMGARVTARLERHGFFPAGGGRVVVEIEPCGSLAPIHITERGGVLERRATAVLARLAGHIGERELDVVAERLGWERESLRMQSVPEPGGPGNAVLLEVRSEHITEVFSAIGELGRPAEAVARDAADEVRHYLRVGAPVGPHLADQLLLPMALAGSGLFVATCLTPHAETNIETIRAFLDVEISTTPGENGSVRIGIGRDSAVPAC